LTDTLTETEPTNDVPEPDTGDVSDTEPENPDAEPAEPDTGDEPESAGRPAEQCEAETTVGGNQYRCALNVNHDGEHAFHAAASEPPADESGEHDADLEARLGKLSKRGQGYSKAALEILGDDLGGLIPCELCGPHWPGLRPPIPPDAETAAKLRVLIGMPSNENFRQDPLSEECLNCGGLGKVLTGSKVSQYETMTCPTCHGRGFRTSRSSTDAPELAPPIEGAEPEPLTVDDEPPSHDPWGRPRGDPDYYRMPIPGATT
jgi:hypothetical protein